MAPGQSTHLDEEITAGALRAASDYFTDALACYGVHLTVSVKSFVNFQTTALTIQIEAPGVIRLTEHVRTLLSGPQDVVDALARLATRLLDALVFEPRRLEAEAELEVMRDGLTMDMEWAA